MKLRRYQLSTIADSDLEIIFEHTLKEYGLDQAIRYLSEIESIFFDPQLGRERAEIKNGLRSIPKSSHIIYYRIMNDHIKIIRVLHSSRDILNKF